MIILEKRTFPERKEKETSNRVIANRIDIDQRPSIVDEKIRFGDLEIDTVIGKNHKGALLSINDRATGYRPGMDSLIEWEGSRPSDRSYHKSSVAY